jgi:D-alanyl-lipoteichoic acid acyltransferase DltB (MBOAT superfamily)
MLFNSLEFGVFLVVVFVLYWFVFNKTLKRQNLFLLTASYFFYGWWDWRFLILIFISSCTDYWVGNAIYRSDGRRKKWLLYVSLIINIGMLGFFKYYNFFIDSFVDAFSFFGAHLEADRLDLILPVGISFYTFQTLSYTLDIYKGKLKPTNDFVSFLGFVSFFPQLVAGPIERARHLLPQFEKARTFVVSKATDGMRQMLWGLFKKVVVADNCAMFVEYVYNNSATVSGSTLLAGISIFMIQIYCDFSGYSDLAIGTARLFGFKLSRNFHFPFYAKSMPDFWRKWHISLTNWFRDYLFIPLSLSFKNRTNTIQFVNTIILFVFIGFWHGASWTFILFGFCHGLLFFRSIYFKRFSFAEKLGISDSNYVLNIGRRILTFFLVVFASMFFPMDSISQSWDFIYGMMDPSLLSYPSKLSYWLILLLIVFLYIEYIQRDGEHALDFSVTKPSLVMRKTIYTLLILSIYLFKAPNVDFIYFQF